MVVIVKKFGLLLILPVLLTGCGDQYSGNTYSHAQAQHVQNMSYGTVLSIRDIYIKPQGGMTGATLGATGGAVAGGLIGNKVGNSTTSTLVGAAVGGVLAGVAGNAIENRKVKGKEYTIKLDNTNSTIVLTQGLTPVISVGQRVQVIYGSGSNQDRVIPY